MEDYLYPLFYDVETTHWWFAARQKILLHYLNVRFPSLKNMRLLDVGCGTGAILEQLSMRCQAHGIDQSAQAIEFCRRRGLKNLFQGELASYPSNERFDILTLFDVIEHLDDDAGTLQCAHRLLTEEGRVLITVPAFPSLWGGHDVATHHRRRYTRATLTGVVAQAGFQIEDLRFFNTFLFPLAVVRRVAARLLGQPGADDLELPSGMVNTILGSIFERERTLVPRIHLPFGLSLLCLARKGAA